MIRLREISLITAGLSLVLSVSASGFSVARGERVGFHFSGKDAPVIRSAVSMFGEDVADVLGSVLSPAGKSKSKIVIRNAGKGAAQGFTVAVRDGRVFVTGNDAQGTAYGILELSRMLGVSPWKWWADSRPARRDSWTMARDTSFSQAPAVEWRGIFINDEDNGLCPWAWQTHDPAGVKGRIGPKTHERIFQLMLRLRANVFWPAMHNCSRPFFTIDGNREMADKYGIVIGTSHCEPMMRSTPGEWSVSKAGEYNYVTNRRRVLGFWEERVREVAGSNCFYTIGMRGIHDTGMEGVTTLGGQRAALQQVIDDQRVLIARHVDRDASRVPQVFIPYKEVLPVYKAGLRVPDDVTLMWCDDNYGYVRHQPTAAERARSGGNGLYYHFSYWGRPQTHVWLPSVPPSLARAELMRAYDGGIQKLWVLNVGDIKPNEYLVEYGLDMAWDASVLHDTDCRRHLSRWAAREFGPGLGPLAAGLLERYYALVYRCRSEFLGHTRVEEADGRWKRVSDLPWTDEEVLAHLDETEAMVAGLGRVAQLMPRELRDSWFELVEYPVRAYAAMARKMLCGQLARHGKAAWSEARKGHGEIFELTDRYHGMLGGKWNRMMGFWKGHSMYKAVDTTETCAPVPGTVRHIPVAGGEWGAGSYLIPAMGYTGSALSLARGDSFSTLLPRMADSTDVTVAFVPVHPELTVTISVDGQPAVTADYHTEGRSEEWKLNIERNQARRTLRLPASDSTRHITVTALTGGVIVDEIRVCD